MITEQDIESFPKVDPLMLEIGKTYYTRMRHPNSKTGKIGLWKLSKYTKYQGDKIFITNGQWQLAQRRANSLGPGRW